MITRRIGFVFLGLAAALAVALGLWAFEAERASASPGDLDVTVSSDPSSGTIMAQGSVITYTVTVNSVGGGTANPVSLSIDLSGLTLIPASLSAGTGITCVAGDPIACTVAVFVAAGSRVVTFQASVGAVGPALVGAALDAANLEDEGAVGASVEDGGDDALGCDGVGELTLPNIGPPGPVPPEEPDNFDCTMHPVGTVDLTITKTASPLETTAVSTGGTITYTITVTNAASATGTATNIPVRESFETAPTKVSVTNVTVTPPDNCSDTALPDINCTIASLAPGASRTITVVVTVTAAAGNTILEGAYVDPGNVFAETGTGAEEADDPLLVCATVGEVAGGSAEPDNFDCTSHTVGTIDLTITKAASPTDGSTVATASTITYTLTATNSGTGAATGVVIRDTLGTGLTFVSITGGTGVTCGDTTAPYDCTASSIPAGESRSVTVVATVSATTGAVLNGAYVDPANAIPESNEDADDVLDCATVGEGAAGAAEPDNFDCTSHTLGAGLDLTLSKTATPAETVAVATGGTITYTLSVSASGGAATSVAIRDTIGTGLSLTSVTPGAGVTCADITAPEINCVAASIASGSSVTVTVNTTVTATSGAVLNGARVDPGSLITETNEDADDPALVCSSVGEGSDPDPATDPDNFDCTSHTVGGAAGTRTLTLSPAGWHNFVWTGATGTAPETALACIAGKYQIAYEWVASANTFHRFVPGAPTLSNMLPLTQYDPLLVLITTEGVTCQMSVAP